MVGPKENLEHKNYNIIRSNIPISPGNLWQCDHAAQNPPFKFSSLPLNLMVRLHLFFLTFLNQDQQKETSLRLLCFSTIASENGGLSQTKQHCNSLDFYDLVLEQYS